MNGEPILLDSNESRDDPMLSPTIGRSDYSDNLSPCFDRETLPNDKNTHKRLQESENNRQMLEIEVS
jgi:hypothetical protein